MLSGIPGSGKSTWSRQFIKDKKDWVIVNRDSLRNMRGDYWVPEQEEYITELETHAVIKALDYDNNVIIDATNLNSKTIEMWNNLARIKDVAIETKFFKISLKEAIERDSKRENPVGEKVIKNFYYKYIVGSNKDKYTDDRFILKQDESLPKALICDLDGCLALTYDRNIYDGSKVHQDKVNYDIKSIVQTYEALGHTIYFITGRDNKFRDVTLEWIRKNVLPNTESNWALCMREDGDHRKDNVIKKEVYDTYIKDNYWVQFVLEDRDKVVKMWRDLGLTCLQVYYGNF